MPRCADDYRTARSGFAPTKRWAKRHLVDLAQPDHAPAGGQLVAVLNLIMPGLPSGRSVIALWEVDEVARTRSLPHAARAHQTQPIISETCPPGEGDLFRVKADTTGSRRSSRAALCRLSCWFVSSGANARWAQVGGALRKYSAHVGGRSAISSTWRSPITLRPEGNSSPF